jgi:predicted TIM-barrel fold metal-dependent hydrolase
MSRQRWRRKWETDALTDGWSPIPTQIVSNEEYAPLPPTRAQRAVTHHLWESSRRHAKALGMTRREFLGSSCGMAAAFLALNEVFGHFFQVEPVEAREAAATLERLPKRQFIFDVQTHHVGAPRQSPTILQLRSIGRRLNPDLPETPRMEDLYLENYIKEIFLDSDTTVAIISGLPSASEPTNILPPDKMAETRAVVNRLASSRRVVTHGLIIPSRGTRDLDEMERQARDLKVEAWKGYTGQLIDERSWTVDDVKVGYPMLEKARRLGVKNICLHKGFPFPGTPEGPWHPRDIEAAARDFPDLNFIVYHSGLKSFEEAARVDLSRPPGRVDWVTDLCEIRQRNPGLTNIYAELGTTFGGTAITAPMLCGHILGMLIQSLGADHVLWGTDSIWWGSPRYQIEAFQRFTMPESLAKTFGYAPLTPEVKARILGLNAAAVFGVDPNAILNRVPTDFVSRMKAAYLEEGPQPSLTQYGWVLDPS